MRAICGAWFGFFFTAAQSAERRSALFAVAIVWPRGRLASTDRIGEFP
jgi:hypothetical protein